MSLKRNVRELITACRLADDEQFFGEVVAELDENRTNFYNTCCDLLPSTLKKLVKKIVQLKARVRELESLSIVSQARAWMKVWSVFTARSDYVLGTKCAMDQVTNYIENSDPRVPDSSDRYRLTLNKKQATALRAVLAHVGGTSNEGTPRYCCDQVADMLWDQGFRTYEGFDVKGNIHFESDQWPEGCE